jgi:NIPSNAP
MTMITCHLRYMIDPGQLDTFERYGRVWITLVNRFGGVHHGYLMPSEGASNIALASFTFPSLAAYEAYRTASFSDPECLAAFAFAQRTKCILSYDRTFFRPVTEGLEPSQLS